MFNYIHTELSHKQLEIQSVFAQIQELESEQRRNNGQYFAKDELLNSLKGILFVLLYGCIEYSVSESIKVTENIISLQNLPLSQVKPTLITRFLHEDFDALHNVGRKQKWQKRLDFMQKLIDDNIIVENICDNLELPTDGKNIRSQQLKAIFDTFSINTSLLTPHWGGRLKDIVDNRNAIAHGNKTASAVGRPIFITDLQNRINEVNQFCTEFITIFTNYVQNKEYKR
ncbi:MAE_28990/MAE_18760 family HEPN-like nuclease [Glaesserella parasuis]|uniref:MAE_28990/MAE_18760 family HEPN-like nuclease n=1 Tax=Glaesserella parasuis TaxID=738 RepID=UPI0013652984|nr:MAE_28990/MAE_18760 family HEPN-like nuclease [Glaesserella parasuis]MDG6241531.1 MAE_28990/MAE_18760 family HEPN-like nuclease [Glaesserella parasuis]MDG6294720.1 MAE_28990/MAE_18760 family HEPN-like nuclease [Glaesserella parasuis]MDG6791166.1 MAE_28990/MAE_18760 family HEPN-like nuclease [Glaesserella parasuis]MDO9818670.1 MAE_28990/MAE_18760 family HEPN-like nuclease [Glaesserella parasuis]MDO9829262.1 MAE_28990/MAE_18760 family HEPN-like nuclease [Glaesserella parasuis]